MAASGVTPTGVRLEQTLKRLFAWASGRLPRWARRRVDTCDIVQEATLSALERFQEVRIYRSGDFEAYVRRSIRNRIVDEVRRAKMGEVAGGDRIVSLPDSAPDPYADVRESENRARFRAALLRLDETERMLVVGRVELSFDYTNLAAAVGKPSASAARMATRRAILKIARIMGERGPWGRPGSRED